MQRPRRFLRRIHLAAFALGCAVALPATVHAQALPFHFNAAAGASIPTGDYGNGLDVGWNITGGIGMRQAGTPLGFRAEAMYNEFGISNSSLKSRVSAGTLDATFDLSQGLAGTGSLYAIGGVGYYHTAEDLQDVFGNSSGSVSDSNIGWNIGAGFRFPLTGFSAYVEARYHTVTNNNVVSAHFIPIVFGLVF